MKITLDQAALATAVIDYLRNAGVASRIVEVDFRYTRVPYTVFAEVELAEAEVTKPAKMKVVVDTSLSVADDVPPQPESLVDPDTLTPEDPIPPEEPRPESPAAPLFGGG